MTLARIQRFEVHAARLEIPLDDFARLPQLLGCSLHTSAGELVLADEQPCELRFVIEDGRALLVGVEVRGDVQGRFLRQVLGPLLLQYRGDLDAELEWSPPRTGAKSLLVLGGTSTHPLWEGVHVATGPRALEARVEALLAEARRAWAQYQRLRRRDDAGRAKD